MIFINYFIKEDGFILRLLDNFQDVILISFGAVLGSNIRCIIYEKLEKINLSKNYIILLINTFSSFSLGLLLSFLPDISSLSDTSKLGLFFSIGILGSLSTFSSFIYDLYELSIELKFYRALKLFLISLISGILAFAVGFSLAIQ